MPLIRSSTHPFDLPHPTRPRRSSTRSSTYSGIIQVEIIKENSDFLRHPLMGDLVDENNFISEEAMQVRVPVSPTPYPLPPTRAP